MDGRIGDGLGLAISEAGGLPIANGSDTPAGHCPGQDKARAQFRENSRFIAATV